MPAPAAPTHVLTSYAVTGLSLSTACAARGEPFDVHVTTANLEAANGTARIIVAARQFGNLVNEDVALLSGQTRELRFSASIEFAGVWATYAVAPQVSAPEVSIRVVERDRSCP